MARAARFAGSESGDQMKSGFFGWFRAMLALVALFAAAQAQAATYNIILKTNQDVTLACAQGGFSFTKTIAGLFPTSGGQVTASADCFAPSTPALTLNSIDINALVVTTSLQKPGTGCPSPYPNPPPATPPAGCQIESLSQGPNVEGIRGALRQVVSGSTYDLVFSAEGTAQPFTRTFSLERVFDSGGFRVRQTVATGKYYVFNTTRAVPEPGTLVLGVLALSLLAAFAWSRRRALARSRGR